MKRLLLLPILFFFAATLFVNAGDKCKFDYDKVDKFSGNHVRYTGYTLSSMLYSYPFKVQLGDNAGKFYFNYLFVQSGDNLSRLSTTDTSFIKLENGKTIKLSVTEDVAPTAQVAGASVVTYYSPIFYIKKSKMQALAESPIVALKLVIAGKEYTVEVKESKAKKIMEAAGCLVSEHQE